MILAFRREVKCRVSIGKLELQKTRRAMNLPGVSGGLSDQEVGGGLSEIDAVRRGIGRPLPLGKWRVESFAEAYMKVDHGKAAGSSLRSVYTIDMRISQFRVINHANLALRPLCYKLCSSIELTPADSGRVQPLLLPSNIHLLSSHPVSFHARLCFVLQFSNTVATHFPCNTLSSASAAMDVSTTISH